MWAINGCGRNQQVGKGMEGWQLKLLPAALWEEQAHRVCNADIFLAPDQPFDAMFAARSRQGGGRRPTPTAHGSRLTAHGDHRSDHRGGDDKSLGGAASGGSYGNYGNYGNWGNCTHERALAAEIVS